MLKLFYISKANQKLNEFKYLSKKSILIYVSIVLFIVFFILGIVNLLELFASSKKDLVALKSENKILREQLSELTKQYKDIHFTLKTSKKEINNLRIAANLPPLSQDEILLGTGGSEFEKSSLFKSGSIKELDGLIQLVDNLSLSLKFEVNEHKIIAEKLRENKILFASIPAILPTKGIIGEKGFGIREHPILGFNKMHEGIDIITQTGSEVKSSGDGIVSFVGAKGGYGLTVEVEHAFEYKTVYAHLSATLVKEGQKVKRGKIIALTGNSGLSTGPHLHYEVHHDGIKLDPTQFFFDDLAIFEPKK